MDSRKRWTLGRWTLGAAALLLAAAVAAPASAQSVTIPQGDDGWVTQGGGLTTVDLSSYPISSAFPGGSITSGSTVNLKGSPLNSSQLGSIDTIVTRSTDLTLSGPGTNGNINLTVHALSMVSDSSNVTISGHGTYSLAITLSTHGTSTGTMNATLSNSDGGTFSSSFNVVPKIVFTNVSNPSDVVTIDCGVTSGCPSNSMSSSGSGWARTGGSGGFNPAGKGATNIPSGVVVNGYTTIGTSNFYGGYAASASTGFPSAPGVHTANCATHQITPPRDCGTTQFGTLGTGAHPNQLVAKQFCHAIFTNANQIAD